MRLRTRAASALRGAPRLEGRWSRASRASGALAWGWAGPLGVGLVSTVYKAAISYTGIAVLEPLDHLHLQVPHRSQSFSCAGTECPGVCRILRSLTLLFILPRFQYANIFKLVDELGISDPFTPWTQSSFYSPQGLQVKDGVWGLPTGCCPCLSAV